MNQHSRRHWMGRTGGLLAGPALGKLALGSSAKGDAKSARIKVGQIGVAHAHSTKLSVYRDSPDYEVVGIVEPDAALREAAKSKPAFHGVPWLTREQLFKKPGLQAVLVETRVRDLLDTAEECIEAGFHVHLDKPPGESLPQYQRILEKATQRKLWVQMGYMYRYSPAVIMLRELLKQGWLGDIFEVHTVMSKVVPPKDRLRFAEFQGGMMFELGCHVIDLMVGILGAPKRVTPFSRHSSKSFDDKLADNMLAVFEYPRSTATVRATALEVDGGQRRHLVVCGTEGTFQIQPLDNPSAKLTLAAPRGPYREGEQLISFARFARYVADAADMARVIRGEKEIDFTPSHDLAVQTAVIQASGIPFEA